MRDKIIVLAMCALLAVSLFACGDNRGQGNDSDILGDEQHQTGTNGGTTNGNTTNNGTTNGSTTNNGTTSGNNNSGVGNNGTNNSTTGNNGTNNSNSSTNNSGTQNVTTGNNAKQSDVMGDSALRGSTINPANGSADRTASWEQMLRNGRVQDRDGFLFDGENSHWN